MGGSKSKDRSSTPNSVKASEKTESPKVSEKVEKPVEKVVEKIQSVEKVEPVEKVELFAEVEKPIAVEQVKVEVQKEPVISTSPSAESVTPVAESPETEKESTPEKVDLLPEHVSSPVASPASSTESFQMTGISAHQCVDLFLTTPEELRSVGEMLALIAGCGDNEAEFPISDDLYEYALDKAGLKTVVDADSIYGTVTNRIAFAKSIWTGDKQQNQNDGLISNHIDKKAKKVTNESTVIAELKKKVISELAVINKACEAISDIGSPRLAPGSGSKKSPLKHGPGHAAGKAESWIWDKIKAKYSHEELKFLHSDYWLWSSLSGNVPMPTGHAQLDVFPLLEERMNLLSVLESAPVSELSRCIAKDTHVLMNLQTYVDYEEHTPCEKARKTPKPNLIRRCLSNILSEKTVETIMSDSTSVSDVLKKIDSYVKSNNKQSLVIPVVKEKKPAGKDDKKGKNSEQGKKGKTAASTEAKKPEQGKKEQPKKDQTKDQSKEQPKLPEDFRPAKRQKSEEGTQSSVVSSKLPSNCGKLDGDEMGHLIYYRVAGNEKGIDIPGAVASAGPGCKLKAGAGGASAGGNPAYTIEQRIAEKDFGLIWASPNLQGHTNYSFRKTALDLPSDTVGKKIAEAAAFGRIWAQGGDVPQGHTGYSFYFGTGASSGSSSAPVAKKKQESTDKKQQDKKPATPQKSEKVPGGVEKTEKPAVSAPTEVNEDLLGAINKLDIRVGLIKTATPVPGGKSFKLDIDMGEGISKQVISGIQKFYSKEELTNRKVLTYFNIKPAKLAGEASEAMVLAGSVDNNGPNEACELMDFEDSSKVEPGMKLTIEGVVENVGIDAPNTSVKNISKQWAKFQPCLTIKDRYGYFLNHRLLVNKIPLVVKSLKKAAIC